MNKRQRKKIMLNGLNKEERYRRTHCPVCKDKIEFLTSILIHTVFALNIVAMNTMEFQDNKVEQ